jgi:hypothetical protein
VLRTSTLGLLVVVLFLSACSAQRELPSSQRTIVGILCVTGNEPFTNISLQTEDGQMLNIQEDTTVLYRGLRKLQGQKLRVQFRPATSTRDPSLITLERYDLVKNP